MITIVIDYLEISTMRSMFVVDLKFIILFKVQTRDRIITEQKKNDNTQINSANRHLNRPPLHRARAHTRVCIRLEF